jgi:hypothetical protein
MIFLNSWLDLRLPGQIYCPDKQVTKQISSLGIELKYGMGRIELKGRNRVR